MRIERRKWYKLDNAALLYPAVATYKWSSCFRLSAVLHEPIDPDILYQALQTTLARFPAFKVRIRSGLFWHYLEEIPEPLPVQKDTGHPCMPFRLHNRPGYLLRVFYYGSVLSVEFFHVLTDGSGGTVFLKTLCVQYLRLKGKTDVCFDHGALDPASPVEPGEVEDEFCRMELPKVRISRSDSKAWHFPATAEIPHTLNLISASMAVRDLMNHSHAMNVSITEYLVSAFLFVAQCEQLSQKSRHIRQVRVSVPINMRRFVKTQTLRNFSSFVNPGIDPALGEYTFEEVCRSVHAFMAYHTDPKLLKATIATNVADEKHTLLRFTPLFLKNLCISSVFHRAGERLYTTTLSNLGLIDLPTGTQRYIRSLEFCLGPAARPLWNAACCSCGNELRLVFTGTMKERTFPRELFRFLVGQGIPVTITSNDEE